ncbi:conserved hypothetical protein [Methylocella tundrae]|uniref:DUF4376 domain-containing protein n=1 Tax=Methylocella tundrae TaxID=227605 RepID=A0A8B6MBU2_METTU|nr:hypothetical protein [Methylocella tundrae]VTZ52470.1 conserved hypothetical protein [Methylocella tundrae]
MFALKQNGVAVELFAEKPVLHPDVELVDVSAVPDIAVGWIFENGAFLAPPPPPPPTRAELEAYAAAKWASVIASGTVTAGGFQSSTAEQWQGYVSRAVQLSQTDPSTPILWNGVTPITPSQLQALGAAVGIFVQAAFTAEGAAQAAIAAGTITTFAGIDAAAWPANS